MERSKFMNWGSSTFMIDFQSITILKISNASSFGGKLLTLAFSWKMPQVNELSIILT